MPRPPTRPYPSRTKNLPQASSGVVQGLESLPPHFCAATLSELTGFEQQTATNLIDGIA